MYLFKRFRSFIAENLESVGQRASKLLAVKVGGLKKKSANQPHFIFTAIKDINLSKKHTKSQEAGSILKVFFALSKGPHFHRADLVTVYKCMFIALYCTRTALRFNIGNAPKR